MSDWKTLQMIKASGWPLAPERLSAPDANFNARLEGGLVPLHWACAAGKAGLVKHMIERGADVLDVADADQRSPLALAVKSGDFQTVMLLIDRLKAIGAPPADAAMKRWLTNTFSQSHTDAKNRLAQTLRDWERVAKKAAPARGT